MTACTVCNINPYIGHIFHPKCQNALHVVQNPRTVVEIVARCTPSLIFGEQIVNYVGVQCEVQEEAEDCEFRERLRKIPLPEELMRDGHDDDEDI